MKQDKTTQQSSGSRSLFAANKSVRHRADGTGHTTGESRVHRGPELGPLGGNHAQAFPGCAMRKYTANDIHRGRELHKQSE